MPSVHPLNLNEGVVESVEFIRIDIIWKAEHKSISAHWLKVAFVIKVQLRGGANILPTHESLCESHKMLATSQSLFSKPSYAKSQKWRLDRLDNMIDLNDTILLCSPYCISCEKESICWKQIDKLMYYGLIEPSQSNFGSAVLYVT